MGNHLVGVYKIMAGYIEKSGAMKEMTTIVLISNFDENVV